MTPFWKLPGPQVMLYMGPHPRTKRVTKGVSYQILHAKYLLELLLQKFVTRSANFDIVFFQGSCLPPEDRTVIDVLLANRHLTQRTGDTTWVVCSRRLARRQLFNHLTTHLRDVSAVFCFSGPDDPKWIRYLLDRRVRPNILSDELSLLTSLTAHVCDDERWRVGLRRSNRNLSCPVSTCFHLRRDGTINTDCITSRRDLS